MKTQTSSPLQFRNMISEFCDKRVRPHVSEEILDKVKSYLDDLIVQHRKPPMRRSQIDWLSVASESRVDCELTGKLKNIIRPALEALIRWVDNSVPQADHIASKHKIQDRRPALRLPKPDRAPASVRIPVRPKSPSLAPADPVEEFPEPLFAWTEDPQTFQQALNYHMRRFGETYWRLHRAIIKQHEIFDIRTISNWANGTKTPRSADSFDVLTREEKRYRLPESYFKSRLPHQARSIYGHELGSDVSAAERRRIVWHLPDDFNQLSFSKREEILEWVRRVIISGSTDYRQFQRKASKQRYAIRFPGISYGTVLLPRVRSETLDFEDSLDEDDFIEDPDLLAGVVDAPPRLAMEMANLVRFKTATLTSVGFQRNGVWGEETASQKVEHLGLLFGALAASPDSEVRGRGIPLRQITFGLLVFPGIWDWYLQWREKRRGFYTSREQDMLSAILGMTRPETGWMWQHAELAKRLQAIPGLVTAEEIDFAQQDWHGACAECFKHATHRSREIQRVMRVHRDPFEPIMCVLEADSPLAEYRKITDEIIKRLPDENRYPVPAAEAVRSFLMLRLGLHLGLRQKNLRQLLICPRGHFPTPERRLEDMKRGEIRWSDRDKGWEVLIPSNAFKNANSSFFGAKPFRLVLPDLIDLYKFLNDYIERHRAVLLRNARDPGTLFVKTVKTNSKDAAYDQTTFYEAWRLTIQRYGIYNPYTDRGAITGLLPHGPHNVRDVLATHILKQTGSYEQASYAIQDTPDMVASHYGRFLPQDKAAHAARILNQVWMKA
ncbi:hypothetical protein [Ochrobactrum quorumnocens]|uniref:Uncharacterized protein n=1 Tax=Ochrobactrum quorumnocens TaxID=271865 RepID=A0A5N1JN84_9HYPH|nr:hypothetical protein [[Ochrobactrum] quorumnocens]KAA9361441.1 hypothetical protein F3W84_20305 [[Ochrobactrum] quorumnocens]